jgi:hypothetical protein
MNRSFTLIAVATAGALALPAAAGAAPKLKASPSFSGDRMVVTVTSAMRFTAKSRPRAVKVAAGGAPYELTQAKRSARKSVWRSARLTAGQLGTLSARRVRISIRTAAGTVTQRRSLPRAPAIPAPAPAPVGTSPAPWVVPPVPTPPRGPELTAPGVTLTPDDAAGRAALSGDLLLERVESGSVTMTYRRIFLYGTGVFRIEKADWNQVSGEICDASARSEGTWSFYRGYTFPEKGGGVIVEIIATVSGGQPARDLLLFGNAEPNSVYVGTAGVRYERNPNMRDQC